MSPDQLERIRNQEEPKLEQRIPPEGLAGANIGELEMQVFAPGMASNTAEGLEAGAVRPSGPYSQDVLTGEPIPPSFSIPIFIFGFMFVLFAIFLAKKMKLIKGDIIDKHSFVQMEKTHQALAGGVSGVVSSVRANSPNFPGNPLSQLSSVHQTAASIGRGFSQELNQSVWNAREQGVLNTLKKVGKLKRQADHKKML